MRKLETSPYSKDFPNRWVTVDRGLSFAVLYSLFLEEFPTRKNLQIANDSLALTKGTYQLGKSFLYGEVSRYYIVLSVEVVCVL